MDDGGGVNDRTAILLGVLAGAVVGGAAGYLFFTDDGRRLREDLEPRLADLMTEIDKARSLVDQTRQPRAELRADVRPFGR